MATEPGPDGNLLLELLPSAALKNADVREEQHPLRTVLIKSDETPRAAFFPHSSAVASIVRMMSSGQMVETGIASAEGFVNVQAALAGPVATGSAIIVQNEGTFSRIALPQFSRLFNEHEVFRGAVLAYTSLFLDQVTQNLVCNRLHSIEQRLAKWLLVMRDRTLSDELHLTQEFLSYMLGVHRPGVSLAVSALENDGIIGHRRNRIEIRDRESMIARSCECYRPLHNRLLEFKATLRSKQPG